MSQAGATGGAFPEIGELVPHRKPILALDEVLEWTAGHLVARMTLDESSPFAVDGYVEGVVAIEYMAQAIAACLGMEAYQGGENVRVGMVIACREMTLAEPRLELGVEYRIEATCERGNDHTSVYRTTMTRVDGTAAAAAAMTLVHGEAPPGTGA